ncbi:DUF429 domain-containing protein [Desulfovibrio psychrotolerans]|uniref:DUF429 domain-containing protein n=1 Tax=Desulfovibrio psychrotolerans TaxID=415242 RepID=A0A7J0BVA8_9BACT|nr:DUF429 domain-containing protein [Desulfovibrio psychrotolerans]GFM37598.1 hypothetical protein DSM19430T_22820 [Desulfovibrio psychrotolerans]
MHICGFDMTSAPARRKPIVCAQCRFDGTVLHLQELTRLESVQAFAEHLAEASRRCRDGEPWAAGLDFPFGQPLEFLHEAGWPTEWSHYVRHAAGLNAQDFAQVIYAVMANRPAGKKLIRRLTDRAAHAASPMSLAYVPVARMFHVLAPVLEAGGADVVPFRMGSGAAYLPQAAGGGQGIQAQRDDAAAPQAVPVPQRPVLLEAYPALLARAVLAMHNGEGQPAGGGRRKATAAAPYKDGLPAQRVLRRANRERLLRDLPEYTQRCLGITLRMPQALCEAMVQDAQADALDAVLCAVQTARASRLPDWGFPAAHDCGDTSVCREHLERMCRTEGWIAGTGLSGLPALSGLPGLPEKFRA